MSEAIIQSIVVGVVAIISAFVGGFVPHMLQKRTELISLKRSKLEGLYVDIEKWYNVSFNILVIDFHLVFEKHIDWNTYLDRICTNTSQTNHLNSEIVLSLYFPELKQYFDNSAKALRELHRFIDQDIKSVYLRGQDINILRDEYNKRMNDMVAKFKEINEKIKEIAMSLR